MKKIYEGAVVLLDEEKIRLGCYRLASETERFLMSFGPLSLGMSLDEARKLTAMLLAAIDSAVADAANKSDPGHVS